LKITVVGLGKIGLPLAVQFASRGHEVLGADVNAGTVETINSGQEPLPGEAHLEDMLAEAVVKGLLTATTDPAAPVAGSDAVVVVVPLFVDGAGLPDFGWMDSATKEHYARTQDWHARCLRDHTAGRHDSHQMEAHAGGGLRPDRGH
jgi:UDP-N-acetyl-D-mannosaminuronate dehydrogenase